MLNNRFILAIGLLTLLLVALTVSYPFPNDPTSVDTSWPPRPVIRPIPQVSNLEAYFRSERILMDPQAGPAIYLQSERTFIDPQAGMAIYHISERTGVPVHFTKYQFSEWFGG